MEGSAAVPEQQQPAPAQGHTTLDPLRHHKHYQGDQPGPQYADGSSFMERMSERVASGMGTVRVPDHLDGADPRLGLLERGGALHRHHGRSTSRTASRSTPSPGSC